MNDLYRGSNYIFGITTFRKNKMENKKWYMGFPAFLNAPRSFLKGKEQNRLFLSF